MASFESSSPAPVPRVSVATVVYESLLLETDRKALFKRIEVAEAAMFARLEVLDHTPESSAERQEIESATREEEHSAFFTNVTKTIQFL